jgi:hypothetical protein
VYMTTDFLSGHIHAVFGDVGKVGATVNANVTERVKGSPQHVLIIYIRLALTLAIWLLGGLGGLHYLLKRNRDLTLAILAGMPFLLLGLQTYGGEVLLRVFFFNLPFVAFFVAALFYPSPTSGQARSTALLTLLISCLLLAGFQFARYGNERMDYITAKERAGIAYLYEIASPGARFVAASWNLPWNYRDVERFELVPSKEEFVTSDWKAIIRLTGGKDESYIVFTRSAEAHGEMFYSLPPGWGDRARQQLLASGQFKQIFDNGDVQILARTD